MWFWLASTPEPRNKATPPSATPATVAGVALGGVALFSDQERADYLANWTPRVPIDTAGSQFDWAVERYCRIWPDLTAEMLQVAVVEVMRVLYRYDWGYQAAFRHDPARPGCTASGTGRAGLAARRRVRSVGSDGQHRDETREGSLSGDLGGTPGAAAL